MSVCRHCDAVPRRQAEAEARKAAKAAMMRERKRCANLVRTLDGIIPDDRERELAARWVEAPRGKSPYEVRNSGV
jgi:hypothetical protein